MHADERDVLMRIAVRAVDEPLRTGRRWVPTPGELRAGLADPGASFVTLRRNGTLLGCIGSLVPHRSLGVDVAHNAAAAAFDDPRMPAVMADDLAHMQVHVSVLGRLEPWDVHGWRDLAARLRPGVDGLLIDDDRHRATFLPSVWDQLGDPAAFLDALWAKAGLPARVWPQGLLVSRYTVDDAEGPAAHYLPPA